MPRAVQTSEEVGVVILVVVESQDFVCGCFIDGICWFSPLITVLEKGFSFLEIPFDEAIDVTH